MARRALVVDDHAEFRSAARAMLELAGFAVVGEAGTPAEALDAARSLAPDLVLLDIRLPDGDGIALASELSQLSGPTGAPDVVLVSSRPARTYGARLAAAPVRGFLAKDELSGPALTRLLGDHEAARED